MKELLLFIFLPQLSFHFWKEVHSLIKYSAGTKTNLFKELWVLFNYIVDSHKDCKFCIVIFIVIIFGIFVPLTSLTIALQIYYANRYIDNFPELYI